MLRGCVRLGRLAYTRCNEKALLMLGRRSSSSHVPSSSIINAMQTDNVLKIMDTEENANSKDNQNSTGGGRNDSGSGNGNSSGDNGSSSVDWERVGLIVLMQVPNGIVGASVYALFDYHECFNLPSFERLSRDLVDADGEIIEIPYDGAIEWLKHTILSHGKVTQQYGPSAHGKATAMLQFQWHCREQGYNTIYFNLRQQELGSTPPFTKSLLGKRPYEAFEKYQQLRKSVTNRRSIVVIDDAQRLRGEDDLNKCSHFLYLHEAGLIHLVFLSSGDSATPPQVSASGMAQRLKTRRFMPLAVDGLLPVIQRMAMPDAREVYNVTGDHIGGLIDVVTEFKDQQNQIHMQDSELVLPQTRRDIQQLALQACIKRYALKIGTVKGTSDDENKAKRFEDRKNEQISMMPINTTPVEVPVHLDPAAHALEAANLLSNRHTAWCWRHQLAAEGSQQYKESERYRKFTEDQKTGQWAWIKSWFW